MQKGKEIMKRLVGGDFLLDLSALDLSEEVTSVSISSEEVLEQLNNLKGFIGKDKNLKPLWVKAFVNGDESDTQICTRGEIQKIDELTFKLIVNLMSIMLIVDIAFEQLQNDDNDYIDDYAIDTATYTLTSDASVGGDLEVTGDASVGGDLEVTGDASVGGDLDVTGDADFKDDVKLNGKNAMAIFDGLIHSSLSENLSVVASYVKAVRNFNELQFIFNCRLSNTGESDYTKTSDTPIAEFHISDNNVQNKIYAHNGEQCSTDTSRGAIAYTTLFITEINGVLNAQTPQFVSLYHNNGTFYFYIEGAGLEIEVGETLDFEARISLSL